MSASFPVSTLHLISPSPCILTPGTATLTDISHSGRLANVLSLLIPGSSWSFGNHPGWHVSSLRNRLLSVSVAAGSPVLPSDGNMNRRIHPTPPLALVLPGKSMNISLRGSCSTDTILLCNRRVTLRPDSGRRSALLRENVPVQSHTP